MEVFRMGIPIQVSSLIPWPLGSEALALNWELTVRSIVFVVSFRTGSAKYKELENSIFVGSETVRSLPGGKQFLAGLQVSQVTSTETDVVIP